MRVLANPFGNIGLIQACEAEPSLIFYQRLGEGARRIHAVMVTAVTCSTTRTRFANCQPSNSAAHRRTHTQQPSLAEVKMAGDEALANQ
jgi:hypothetical protein